MIIRALGPTLAQPPFSLSATLADPTLILVNSNGAVVASNDDWKNTQEGLISATGYAPPNDLESAILVTVPNGNYTAIVFGSGGELALG